MEGSCETHPEPSAEAALKVHWLKTWVAWLIASALTMAFVDLIAPRYVDFGDTRVIMVMGVMWLAVTVIMVATQISLHRARCKRLSHYLVAYPIVVSPTFFNLIIDNEMPFWILLFAFVVSPAVVLFWCVYALVLRGFPKEFPDMPLELGPHPPTSYLVAGSAAAICLTFLAVFVLNMIATFFAAPLLEGEERHPSLMGHGMIAALVVAYWGTVIHVGVVRNGYPSAKKYTLGFLVFVLGYSLVDFGVMSAVALIVVVNFLVGGWDSIDLHFLPTTFLERIPNYVVYWLFPATIVAGGPLLWWIYHRALPRVWPESLQGE